MAKSEKPPKDTSNEETPSRFTVNILFLPVFFAIGLLVGYAVWGRSAVQRADPTQTANQAEGQTQEVKRYPVEIDDDPALGAADAPITIIEFSDYQCPFCKRWFDQVYHQLLETYGGQIRLVFRDLPLTNIHPEAQPAAEAANCAHEQGAFWEFHDQLFGAAEGLSSQAYLSYASQAGLDMARFEQCVAERRYQAEVEADLAYAVNLGVNSTPTFFINGIPIIGAQGFEVFQYVIDKELAGELP
jgi:protein-disulfide isomerase